MHIKKLLVRNFRGLERISLEAGAGLNVIAGPNAVGKTTILEAVRLVKVLLAPRFQGEAQNALAAMGAVQNGIIALNSQFAMFANDSSKPIDIQVQLSLDQDEISLLTSSKDNLALMMLQTQLARSVNENAFDLAQYLSTVEGQNNFAASRNALEKVLIGLTLGNEYNLNAIIDVNNGQVRGTDPNGQLFIGFLESVLPPNQSNFNYFTADRALPVGEVGIQLGAGDVQQQVMSYLAQPSTKWGRVKQLIIQTILFDEHGRERLANEFNLIFDELLPGKRLSGVNFNEHSVLRVLVEDRATGKVFDIDSMSSGEKGLVLTFLTLRLSSKNGTIVLLDEPELHLNAAVCARIVKYISKHCVEEKNLQLFVCSHSPEVVRDAFDDDRCKLFHLRSAIDLSPVYQQDSREVFEILNRLGASTADVLFTRGSVFVEGDHDAAILQAGYGDLLQGFRVQSLGGRTEVEKEIPKLQQQEKSGKLDKKQLFIFDRDRKASSLNSTELVKVHQLERYCIENYLLDDTILFDLIISNSSTPPESRGSFVDELEDLALMQLSDHVISTVYAGLEPENAGLRSKEIRALPFTDAADSLWARIGRLRTDVANMEESGWKSDFIQKCEAKRLELESDWRAKWRTLASGKVLIDDIYKRYGVNMRKVEFKKEIISKMAELKSDTWRVLNSILDDELK